MAIHPPDSPAYSCVRRLEQQANRESLDSFPFFAKLPTELRLKIWAFALTPRLVSIRCGCNPSSFPMSSSSPSSSSSSSLPSSSSISSSSSSSSMLGCTSPSPPPSTLHATSESRHQTSHLYRPAFGFARQPGHVLFNPEIDVLFLGPCQPHDGFMASHAQFSTCLAMCDPVDLAAVRRLALSSDVFCVDGNQTACLGFSPCGSLIFDVLCQISRRLPNLEELLFVPHYDPAAFPASDREDAAEARHRLARQIQSALQAVCREMTPWNPPPWSVASLQELSAQMQVDIHRR